MSDAAEKRIAELEAIVAAYPAALKGLEDSRLRWAALAESLKADAVARDAADEAGELAQSWMRKVGEEVRGWTWCAMTGEDGDPDVACDGDRHAMTCERAALLRRLLGPEETQRQVDASHEEAAVTHARFSALPPAARFKYTATGAPVLGPTLDDVAEYGTTHIKP